MRIIRDRRLITSSPFQLFFSSPLLLFTSLHREWLKEIKDQVDAPVFRSLFYAAALDD